MSDELDDEAPPDIPDISSDPEVAPIPALPSELPPPPLSAPEVPRAQADSELDVDIDVELPGGAPESEPAPSVELIEPEPERPAPPPRRRMATNPATPVARASMPAPAEENGDGEPPAEALRAPRAPSIPDLGLDEKTTRIERSESPSEHEDTLRRLPAPGEFAEEDLEEATTRMPETAPLRTPSSPPRPVSQPPRPVSQPPRPVSQPPRPFAQPPRAEPPTATATARRNESEPPTQPWNAPPDLSGDGESAATSYPPPPLVVDAPDEPIEPPPTSLKPMRMISVKHAEGARVPALPADPASVAPADAPAPVPAAPPSAAEAPPTPPSAAAAPPTPPSAAAAPPTPPSAAAVPPPPPSASTEASPVTPVEVVPTVEPPTTRPRRDSVPVQRVDVSTADELSDDDIAPDSDGEEDGDISFPADERSDAAAAEQLADVEIPVERESEPEIAVVIEEEKPPPPPPRRDPPKPPSVAEAKEAQRSKQRKAWWEELFGEDFARANAKLKTPQIVREADFIEESLGVAKGGVLLDLACGGGQHAVELAQRGYGVVGYDLSLYQLAVAADCAQEVGQKLNLLQGDMREMAFEEMFDGIYCWNTSFGYFEEEKNAAVASRIFRALRPGGMFLLDVANRDFVVANQPAQTWFEGEACVCMDDMAVDFITSRLKVKRSLILDDGRTAECGYSIRLYSLHELGKILHDAGFRVTEASGHPSTPGVFFGASSPRILILAQRP